MPDIHTGYGFPIGAVAAMELPDGVVSPGGVGYDINCGVRLLALPLRAGELGRRKEKLVHEIARRVPAGSGREGGLLLRGGELERVLRDGARALAEPPFAYKDVEKVVAVVERAGLAARVAQLRPLGVVKG